MNYFSVQWINLELKFHNVVELRNRIKNKRRLIIGATSIRENAQNRQSKPG